MTYTKRWELIHYLGGRCVKCGNENLYDLEIDHKFNDGDGERALYKDLVGHYLKKLDRAKQRLQLLCKVCHEAKHSEFNRIPIDEAIERKNRQEDVCISIMKKLEGDTKKPVYLQELVAELTSKEYEHLQFTGCGIIKYLEVKGVLYESKPHHYNLVSH